MKHVHIDMDQVEAMIARGNEALKAFADRPGQEGCFGRLSLTVGAAWSRQFAEEINRSTKPDDVRHALAGVITNIICELTSSTHEDNTPPLVLMQDHILTTRSIGEFLMRRAQGMAETVFDASVPAQPLGQA